MAWDVFLAYSAPDRASAHALHTAMTARGLRVCFDAAVLRPGDDWHLALPRHLRASRVVVALCSQHTATAHFERAEVIAAVNLVRTSGGRLVPVRLAPGVRLPYGAEQFHALDMFDEPAVADVAGRIAGLLAGDAPRIAEPPDATPTVTIPPGAAPHRVTCPRAPRLLRHFAGRADVLARLRAGVARPDRDVATFAVCGLGGVGKTSLVAALIDHVRDDVDVVWWVRSAEPGGLAADLAELAGRLGLDAHADAPAAARAARHWCETSGARWLLVFDNATGEAVVEPWLPRAGNGTVLITSRHRHFQRLADVVVLDGFAPDEAENFLLARVAATNPAAAAGGAAEAVRRLDGLPLALEQAAAWVERAPNRTYDDFARLFDDARADATADPFPVHTRPPGYARTATTTWRVSIAAANEEAPLASRILAALSFLAPDAVPCRWLREQAHGGYLRADARAVDEALAALGAYSLARMCEDDTVAVHRLVQAATRREAPPEATRFAVRMLRAQSPGDGGDHAHWPVMATLVPHVLALARTTGAEMPDDARDLWWILDDVARFQLAKGATRSAIATARAALDLALRHLGPEDRDTLASRDSLAGAHRRAGDWTAARALHEANTAEYERTLGPDHPDTLASRANLASACRAAGDLGAAIPLAEATLADHARILGADHPHTLASRDSLAATYRAAGRLDAAMAAYAANTADYERVLGTDHLDTLASRNNMATTCRTAGDAAAAIALAEANTADYERVAGRNHPSTMTSRNNLAAAHRAAGDLVRALVLFEVNLADRARVLGPEHPDTLTSRENLAAAYRQAGNVTQAASLLASTLASRRRSLGPTHPLTIAAERALAEVQAPPVNPPDGGGRRARSGG